MRNATETMKNLIILTVILLCTNFAISQNIAKDTIFLNEVVTKAKQKKKIVNGKCSEIFLIRTYLHQLLNKKVFVGNLNRYTIEEKYCYIKYDDNLKEKPKSYDFFLGERILIRRIINRRFRMMAGITDEEFICKKDIYILKLNDNSIDYKYI